MDARAGMSDDDFAAAASARLVAANRVAIIGNAGGGKSTLARALGRVSGAPVHSVDDVQWHPGWQPAPRHIVEKAHRDWLAQTRWIIDGWGPADLIHQRFAVSEAIVLVDYPIQQHYDWAFERQRLCASGVPGDRPPPGCDAMQIAGRLRRLIQEVDATLLPPVREALCESSLADRLIHMRSPAQLIAVCRCLNRRLAATC